MTPRAAALALLVLAGMLPAGAAEDPRSVILVREDCSSTIGRREVTLFANGTVRLREGAPGQEAMRLGEVGAEEVAAFLRRLAEPDLSETDADGEAPGGTWVEACVLELALPEQASRRFRFGRYASHSLALSSLLSVVRDIEAVAATAVREGDLPVRYEPRPGDLLERADGLRFEVIAFTADGLGVELSSPDQPLTIYVPRDDLRTFFVRLLARRDGS
ncbi:MAG: hypothetical protein F9K18_08415 [Thermoanaerobaculia bacterium]|nr:MAG: hypothetical protein F9K18_08415 [Thermoanaerobaculia bacterium]